MLEALKRTAAQSPATLFLYVVAGISASLACYQAVSDKASSAGILAAMFIISIILTNMEKIKLISAFGMKAEMREVRGVIREAQATLTQVRELSMVFASASFYQASRQGFFADVDWDIRNEMLQSTTRALTQIGMLSSDIHTIRYPMFETASWVIHNNFNFLVLNTFARKYPDQVHNFDLREDGTDPGGMSKLVERVKNDGRFTSEEKKALSLVQKRFEKAKKDSEKKGVFTDDALIILKSENTSEFTDNMLNLRRDGGGS